MTECSHPASAIRFIPDPGALFPEGREVCAQCWSSRRVEGDHAGPWVPFELDDADETGE